MGCATVFALALGGLVGGVLFESQSAAQPSVAHVALAESALAEAGGVSAATVATLEEQARARPRDAALLIQLGFAYQLRWRETADPSSLPRSETALRRAVETGTEDANAVLGLGSLALIRHEFREALVIGRRAERLLPGSARPYGVIGDALVELGRYDEAFRAFERMVSLRPSLASYARVAYARELSGDRLGALSAMRLALDAAAGQPEPTAWSLVELAKLELSLGRIDAAGRHARTALRVFPGYPAARIELARVEVTRGRIDRAGRHGEARRQRSTVAVIDRLLRANGVQVDRESAVYRADNRIRPLETNDLARRARADRPSIYGDDALAWALARAGRCSDALPLAERALRLGTRDALLYFHRGYAERCAGNRAAMRDWYRRALDLNSEFSVRWAPIARAALRNA